MQKFVIAALIAASFATQALADYSSDRLKEIVANLKASIGRTYWIAKPNNKGIEFCAGEKKKRECTYIFDTNFLVTGMTGTKSFSDRQAFVVRLSDGRIGDISYYDGGRFFAPALTPEEAKANRECEKRGAPTIGMTRAQVLVCMGMPSSSNTTETASTTMEQMVYSGRAYVYIENDTVTAVQTSR